MELDPGTPIRHIKIHIKLPATRGNILEIPIRRNDITQSHLPTIIVCQRVPIGIFPRHLRNNTHRISQNNRLFRQRSHDIQCNIIIINQAVFTFILVTCAKPKAHEQGEQYKSFHKHSILIIRLLMPRSFPFRRLHEPSRSHLSSFAGNV